MYPELFRIGDFVVSSFGLMVALAFLTAYYLASHEFKRKGLSETLLSNLFLAAIIGGLVGAKLLYVIENVPLSTILNDPASLILSRGGLTFYGGFFGALFLALLITWKNNISFWKAADAAAPSLAIGHSIGRIGCLLVGDDYGVPSNVPWAIAFPKGAPPTDIPVHPTQIYETVLLGLIFLYLWKIRKRNTPDGWLFAMFLILAGIERFAIEFLRNTSPSPIPGLSIAQLMALGCIAVGVFKMLQVSKINMQKSQR